MALLGKKEKDPIFSTARNFFYTMPFSIALLLAFGVFDLPLDGILYAVLSGVFTSGLGYVLWYLALKNISTTVASIVQLLVPIGASFGGVLFLSESINNRLLISTFFIVLGILITIMSKKKIKSL